MHTLLTVQTHNRYSILNCMGLADMLLMLLQRKLKREAELIQAGHLDSKLEELWEEILQ